MITTGGDGNLWFTEPGAKMIGRVTPLGVITEYATGVTGATGGNRFHWSNGIDRHFDRSHRSAVESGIHGRLCIHDLW